LELKNLVLTFPWIFLCLAGENPELLLVAEFVSREFCVFDDELWLEDGGGAVPVVDGGSVFFAEGLYVDFKVLV